MLEALCGNRTIQKILIFLFVNGRCYGTQLHRQLQTPLTPIQKALLRLERGGIILSYTEGKTRLYQFNPAYPLLPELEQLLKKSYTLLPAPEKRGYYVEISPPRNRKQVLESFWQKLGEISHITFSAKSKEKLGWNGRGKGEVAVVKEGNNTLIFQEKGSWQGKESGEVAFSNIFRWSLDRQAGIIALEHLRRGPDHPVFLFHIAPTGPHTLASIDSHLCEGDTYFGQVRFDRSSLRVNWRVIGPKKNEEIDYYYS